MKKNDLKESHIQELTSTSYEEEYLEAYTVSKDLFSPKVNSDIESITHKFDYPELIKMF